MSSLIEILNGVRDSPLYRGKDFLTHIGEANAPTLYSFDKDGFIKPSAGRVAAAEEQAAINDYNTQRAELGRAERAALDAAIKDILPFYEPASTGDGIYITKTTSGDGFGSSTNADGTTLPSINPDAETTDMGRLNTSGGDTVLSDSLGTGSKTVFNPATALPSYSGDNAVTVLPGDTVSSIAKRYDMTVAEFSEFLKAQYGQGADLNSIVAGSKLPLPPAVYERTAGGVNGLDLPAELSTATATPDVKTINDALVDAFKSGDQFVAFACIHKQLCRSGLQCLAQQKKNLQTRLIACKLQATDVGAVNVCAMGQLFLRNQPLTTRFDRVRKVLNQRVVARGMCVATVASLDTLGTTLYEAV